MAYTGKFTDRSPYLKPAGVQTKNEGTDDVGKCLVHEVSEREAVPFVCKSGPLEYKLPPTVTNIYKGFFTDARECLQPDADQGLVSTLMHEFQDTVHDSYWRKPLGRVADPVPMLPAGMEPENTCFGKATPKDVTAGELINPQKSYVDVMEESRVGHELYKQTHQDFDPGEQIERRYVEPFKRDLIWGKGTPCDPQGGCIKKVMQIEDNNRLLVSKILADHHKRNKALVGKVHAPNNNARCVPEDHTYGRLNKRGIYGAGELMRNCPPSLDKIDLYDQLSHINALRQQISKKEPRFPHRDLIDAFHELDRTDTGCLPLEEAWQVLSEFSIYPDRELFIGILTRLGILSKDQLVLYEKMVDMLNVNVYFPDLEDVPKECIHFETTSQLAQKYHCSENDLDQKKIPRAGIPPRPHVSMESLMSPSIFTNYGLQPEDFFKSRSSDFVRTLLLRLGCEINEEIFKKVWEAAKDVNGCVSINSFFQCAKTMD